MHFGSNRRNIIHHWTWSLLLVCVCCVPISMGFLFDLPLNMDELPGHEHKISQDKPGCYMDGIHYDFGEQWSPVFIQHGVMVCVRCQCLTVERKGALQFRGRTMCRNIKDLCPVPKCQNPTLRPGKCCKSCEGDDFEDNFRLQPTGFLNDIYSQDAARTTSEANDFQALLVGRNVPDGPVATRAIAVVRLTIERDTVQFAVRYTHLDRPKYLRIVHVNGNVLFQTPVVKEISGDRKVCGVWRSSLPIYLDYLREENLMAVITTSRYPDGIVAGRIKISPDRSKELFNSLMVDTTRLGDGAVASISYNPTSKVARYDIITDESVKKGRQGIFTVSIMQGSKVIYKRKGSALAKTTRLSGKWRVHKRRHRKKLARGRLRIRVKFSDGLVMVGDIQPKLTCDTFQAVLSGSQTPSMKKSPSAGSVLMRMDDNGKLHYSIRLSNFVDKVTRIRLEGYRRKKKTKMKLIHNLHPSFVRDSDQTFDGWSNGTLNKVDADTIHGLLHNQLYVSVKVSRRRTKELRGRIVTMTYDEHLKGQAHPFTLTPVTPASLGGAGHVRMTIDGKCHLHFQAVYAGPGRKSGTFNVFLGRLGDVNTGTMLKLPFHKPVGRLYSYHSGAGDVRNIPNEVFEDLDNGKAFVQISAVKNQVVYRANVTIPNTCWMYSNDGDGRLAEDNHFPNQTSQSRICRFESQMYSEGDAWIPDVDAACTTCSCVKGKTMCQRMTCPSLSCDNPIQLEGRCCPSCPHEDPTEMCQLGEDPRSYPLHSLWHPYLPTEGFSLCAYCTCLPGQKVECYRKPCPTPQCPESEWVREDNSSCCYGCRVKTNQHTPEEKTPEPKPFETLSQPQMDINMEGACAVNGEIHPDGEKWYPTIHPFGYMKCFFCLCKAGNFTCHREVCPALRCSKRIRRPKACCEECDPAAQENDLPLVDEPDSAKKGDCRFGNEWYSVGQKWKPATYNGTETANCVVCRCKSSGTQCRQRCPKVCKIDPEKSPCCKHCTDQASKTTRKNENRPKKNGRLSENSKRNRRRKRRRQDKRRRKLYGTGKRKGKASGKISDFINLFN